MWGILTSILALIAAIICGYKYVLTPKDYKLKKTFAAEGSVYLITALFGLATFIEIDLDHFLYPARVIALSLVIFTCYRVIKSA